MQTDRYYLREVESRDIHHIFRGLSNPEVIRYYGVSFDSLDATQEQMDWYANLKQNGQGCWWVIFENDTDQFVGAGGYNDRNTTTQTAELGFWLLPEHWGKGIMQETIPVILQAGFERLDLKRIEGYVETDNQNCRKALHRLGFTHESTETKAELKNGHWIDLATYVIARPKFLAHDL